MDNFTQTTGLVTQSVTGVGFRPDMVMLMVSDHTSDTSSGDVKHCFSITPPEGGGSSVDMTVTCDDVSDPTASESSKSGASVIRIVNSANVALAAADTATLDADGFSFTWSVNDDVARIITYLAIQGVPNSSPSTTTQSPTVAGNESYTGFGYKPNFVMFFTEDGVARNGVGWATSTTARSYSADRVEDGVVGVPNSSHVQRTTNCIGLVDIATDTLDYEADFVSFDDDGFTLNFGTVDAAAITFFSIPMLVNSPGVAVGQITQPTTIGPVTESGLGFRPTAIIFWGTTHVDGTIGAIFGARRVVNITSENTSACHYWGENSGGAGTISNSELNRVDDVRFLSENLTTPDLQANANVRFTGDGFTLDWLTVDATQRQVQYLAWGGLDIGRVPYGLSTTTAAIG